MNDRVSSFLADLDAITDMLPPAAMDCLRRAEWLRYATSDEVSGLFRALMQRDPPATPVQDDLLAAGLAQLVTASAMASQNDSARLEGIAVRQVVPLYHHLGDGSRARNNLFCLLTAVRTPAALEGFVALVSDDPPEDSAIVAAAFSPLFRFRDYDPNDLFPGILAGLAHAGTAAVALDLANFVTRESLVLVHPAAERLNDLASMLGAVVGQLGKLESKAPLDANEAMDTSLRISDGVALTVSLCDALALIGNASVTNRLYQALDLSHRRVRAEAAAALARLGEERGVESLVQLAAEPVVRLRVLAYAEELGVIEKVDAKHTSEQAKAEADLALWLAQPAHMGIPPTTCEMVDNRTQYWPGYEQPINCFLFRFTYLLGDIQFSNIGIAGPVAHAFSTDVTELPVDDLYAAFAGWYAEHDEIYEVGAEQWDAAQQLEVARLQRRMHDDGLEEIRPLRLGYFLGDTALIAQAERDGTAGAAVADSLQIHWLPRSNQQRPPGPEVAYSIYKGRKFLRQFNPPVD